MDITDGKCPYCSSAIAEKGTAGKQINCPGCGRLLHFSATKEGRRQGEQLKSLELGLIFSTVVGCSLAIGNSIILIIIVVIVSGLFFSVWLQDRISGLPSFWASRLEGTSRRLKIFPFELYLSICWLVIVVLRLTEQFILTHLMFSFTMLIAGYFSVQANRLIRESKVTSDKTSLFDFPLFVAIMRNPSSAFDKRKSNFTGEIMGKNHFQNAAVEKEEKDKLIAADHDEISRKREIKHMERKKWEADIENRYEAWLMEESTRLKQEKRDVV